jgi:hypothetical protein
MLYPVLGNFGSSIFIMFLFQNKFPENYSMAWSQSIKTNWPQTKTEKKKKKKKLKSVLKQKMFPFVNLIDNLFYKKNQFTVLRSHSAPKFGFVHFLVKYFY